MIGGTASLFRYKAAPEGRGLCCTAHRNFRSRTQQYAPSFLACAPCPNPSGTALYVGRRPQENDSCVALSIESQSRTQQYAPSFLACAPCYPFPGTAPCVCGRRVKARIGISVMYPTVRSLIPRLCALPTPLWYHPGGIEGWVYENDSKACKASRAGPGKRGQGLRGEPGLWVYC
jgi:hypothetical protein